MLLLVGAAMLVACVASQSETTYFAARSTAFRTENDGLTAQEFERQIDAGVCAVLENRTCSYNATLELRVNVTTEDCDPEIAECTYVTVFSFAGVRASDLSSRLTTKIQTAKTQLLQAIGQAQDIGVGKTLPKSDEKATITTFIVTLACGYLAFSVLLLIFFCVVQKVLVGSAK